MRHERDKGGKERTNGGNYLRLFLLLLQGYTFLPGSKHFIEGIHTDGRPGQRTKTQRKTKGTWTRHFCTELKLSIFQLVFIYWETQNYFDLINRKKYSISIRFLTSETTQCLESKYTDRTLSSCFYSLVVYILNAVDPFVFLLRGRGWYTVHHMVAFHYSPISLSLTRFNQLTTVVGDVQLEAILFRKRQGISYKHVHNLTNTERFLIW